MPVISKTFSHEIHNSENKKQDEKIIPVIYFTSIYNSALCATFPPGLQWYDNIANKCRKFCYLKTYPEIKLLFSSVEERRMSIT